MSNIVKRFTDFEPSELKLGGSKRNIKMNIIFTNNPYIQSPLIYLSSFGIPKAGEFFKTDLDRCFINIPLEVPEFRDKLLRIDGYVNSEQFRKQLFDDNWDKYTYSPIVKMKPNLPPYFKVKFDIDINNKEDYDVNTKIFKVNDGKMEYILCDTIDEIAAVIKYKSNIKFIFSIGNFWIMKSSKTFGLTLKMDRVYVAEPIQAPSAVIDFIDDV
jgi:hypothetical protein